MHDFCHVTDDVGNKYDLTRDPPALVKQMVAESVRRWQWARLDATFSSAARAGALRLPPIAHLLRTASSGWGPAEQAQLRLAVVGGQWTQLRLFRAGRAQSPNCVLRGAAHGAMAHRLWWCEHPELADARRAEHQIQRHRHMGERFVDFEIGMDDLNGCFGTVAN